MTDPTIVAQYKADYLDNNAGKDKKDFSDTIGTATDGNLYVKNGDSWSKIEPGKTENLSDGGVKYTYANIDATQDGVADAISTTYNPKTKAFTSEDLWISPSNPASYPNILNDIWLNTHSGNSLLDLAPDMNGDGNPDALILTATKWDGYGDITGSGWIKPLKG